jgi:hypothetical protein
LTFFSYIKTSTIEVGHSNILYTYNITCDLNRLIYLGRWSKEEEENLIKIVVDITREYDENVSLDWGIPWALVAEAMEYKRSELSCRNKWVKELRLKYELGEDQSSRWTSYDSYMLCKKYVYCF